MILWGEGFSRQFSLGVPCELLEMLVGAEVIRSSIGLHVQDGALKRLQVGAGSSAELS